MLTIFNVVVDAVVCHGESLVAERDGGDSSNEKGDVAQTAERRIWDRDDVLRWSEEGHQRLTVKAALLYADNEVVASTDPGWIQSAFYTLAGIFDRLGLRTNICKTVGVVCRKCRSVGVLADKAYTRRMSG